MAKKESVDEFMAKLDYPLKAEVEMLRAIIKGVDARISEEIKWNAPSYRYKDYIATFNFHNRQQIRLIVHNPVIASIKSDILEGDYPDRRIVYFGGMEDVVAKTSALQYVVGELIKSMDTSDQS
ncbi:MAG: DUF1801 domain-containing protein [Anaerolineae bacterium]